MVLTFRVISVPVPLMSIFSGTIALAADNAAPSASAKVMTPLCGDTSSKARSGMLAISKHRAAIAGVSSFLIILFISYYISI